MSAAQNPNVQSSQPVQGAINALMGGTNFQQKDVVDLKGRTAVVTGGTAGIGFEIAKTLALAGARVLVLSRKQEHGDEAVNKIKELASKDDESAFNADVEFIECDFGDLKNVADVGKHILSKESRIDILINDAGIGVAAYDLDADGIERIFGVNVLGHFLFINLLLPRLRKTAHLPNTPAPRIVSLSSVLHKLSPSDAQFASLKEINDPSLRPDQYYNRSKLAIILYIKALNEYALKPHWHHEKIYALSVHPGAVDTEIQDQFKEAFGYLPGVAIKYLQKPLMRTPEGGSLGTLWAAVAPEVEQQNLQGAYVTDPGAVGGENDQAKDMKLADNVWNLCMSLIKEKLGEDALLSWGEGSGRPE